jgi:hypothetical protein
VVWVAHISARVAHISLILGNVGFFYAGYRPLTTDVVAHISPISGSVEFFYAGN